MSEEYNEKGSNKQLGLLICTLSAILTISIIYCIYNLTLNAQTLRINIMYYIPLEPNQLNVDISMREILATPRLERYFTLNLPDAHMIDIMYNGVQLIRAVNPNDDQRYYFSDQDAQRAIDNVTQKIDGIPVGYIGLDIKNEAIFRYTPEAIRFGPRHLNHWARWLMPNIEINRED